jgi:hypothetical protein
MADALRMSSRHLHRQDIHRPADYIDSAAEQVARLSDYVRDQDLWSLADKAKSMAKRQPELFLGGAFAVGFLVARFLKSSSGSASSSHESGYRTGEAQGEGSRSGQGQGDQWQGARWQQEQWRQSGGASRQAGQEGRSSGGLGGQGPDQTGRAGRDPGRRGA